MIQRKQTLYLIIVLLLMASTFILPSSKGIITSHSEDYYNIYSIMPFEVEASATTDNTISDSLFSTVYLGVIICFTIAWTLLTIFMFKKRWLQIRLTIFLIIWLIGVEALMVAYGYKLTGVLDSYSDIKNNIPISWGAIMPIISIIFSYLAFRGILRDELLIKSLNSNRMR